MEKATYQEYEVYFKEIANYFMIRENRIFVIDSNNEEIIKCLTLYFLNSPLCEEMTFNGKQISLQKNIMLIGPVGTGKSVLMKIFSYFTRNLSLPTKFTNVETSELLNHYKMHGNINKYTYNTSNDYNSPESYCLNDIGLNILNQKNYGTDINMIIDEWLFSRYELWLGNRHKYHVTTNQTFADLKNNYDYRIVDRFKSFNIIPLVGESRR